MTNIYATPITCESDAQGFFFELHQTGRLFHPEDDPATVISGASGDYLFTPDQCDQLRARIDEVYAVMDDPCGYILTLTNPESNRS